MKFLNQWIGPPTNIFSSMYLTSLIDNIFGDRVNCWGYESFIWSNHKKHQYSFHSRKCLWKRFGSNATLSVETIFASALYILQKPSDGLYRLLCLFCKRYGSPFRSFKFDSLCDALEKIYLYQDFVKLLRVGSKSTKVTIFIGYFFAILFQMQSLK